MTSTGLAGVLHYIGLLAGTEGAGEQSDQELLQRFVARRDESAFATLLGRHGSLVLGVCRRVLGDEQDAEDAFQATFLVLARKAGSIRKQQSLAAWLHRVVLNLCRTARAGTARRQALERQAAHRTPAADAEVIHCDWQSLLHEEVDRLPDKYRLPVVLCYFEGKSHADTAEQLDWPLGSVKGRLARARDLLRTRLERRGLVLTATGIAAVLGQGALAGAVPQGLLDPTLRAALSFAGGGAAASANALALAKGVLQAMTATRPAHLLVLMLAVGVLTYALAAGTTPEGQRGDPVPPLPGNRPAQSEAPPRLDRVGDPLPPGAITRLGTLRFRHGQHIQGIAFSPDGKRIASAAQDGRVVLHDLSTGKKLRSFEGEARYANSVAFAPDGKTLAAGVGEQQVCVWEVETGKLIRQFRGADGAVFYLVFSPDGRKLVGSADHVVQVWDVQAGKEMGRITPPRTFRACALAPDGKTLATAADEKRSSTSICLWETTGGRKLHQWPAHKGEMHSLAFSADGKHLASACTEGENQLRVWRVPTGEKQLEIPGEFESVCFSPSGKALAASAGRSVILWDAETGKETRRIPVRGQPRFSPDGKVLGVGDNWTITLWDVDTGKKLGPHLHGHDCVVQSVQFRPDGKTLVSTSRDTLHSWQVHTGKRIGGFEAPGIGYGVHSPDGTILAVRKCSDKGERIELRDSATGKVLHDLAAHTSNSLTAMVFSPDGKTLAVSIGNSDRNIRFWDVVTGKRIREFSMPEVTARQLAYSPDGKTLAVGENDERRWGARAPRVRLLDAVTGREVRKFELPGAAEQVSFSADGKILVAATGAGGDGSSDPIIQAWEVQSGLLLCRLERVSSQFALSPDAKSLVTLGEPPRLWELASGKVRGQVRGHSDSVWSVAFSPDGKLLASGSQDTTVLIWETLNLTGEPPDAAKLSPRELEALWGSLAGPDAAVAYRAIRALVAAPAQAVPFLGGRLKQVPVPDPKHLARLIADLDARQFTVREKAAHELKSLGRLARPALKQALVGQLSLEARRRVEALLQELGPNVLSQAELRGCRALEVLERIGTAQVMEVLEQFVREGSVPSLLARDARDALERLQR